MAVVERRLKNCKTSSYFLRYAKDITSQGGEDGILEAIFACLSIGGQSKSGAFCVDIGAWDGKHLSNTYSLLHDNGWGGILCEADIERCKMLSDLYSGRTDIVCVNSLVDSQSLIALLNDYKVDCSFDFLSIDIDGADYHLWKGLGDIFCPKVVCIEFNPTVPNHVIFIQENDTRIQQGSSLLALAELGNTLATQYGGYQLVCTTLFNAIFVRRDLSPLLPPLDTSLDALHATSMITDIFQTYDGELKTCGPKKLLWHRTSINWQKLQPLSRKQRAFPFAPTSSGRDIKSQFYAVEEALADVVSHVNYLLQGGGNTSCCDSKKTSSRALNSDHTHTSNTLVEALSNLCHICEGALSAGSSSQAVAVEAMLYSAALSSLCIRSVTGLPCDMRKACVQHVVSLSGSLERRGDLHMMDRSNDSMAYELYEHALHVFAHMPHSAYDKVQLLPVYYESCVRVSEKLSHCLDRCTGSDITATTKRLYWSNQAQLLKSFCVPHVRDSRVMELRPMMCKALQKIGVRTEMDHGVGVDNTWAWQRHGSGVVGDHDIEGTCPDVANVLHRACGHVRIKSQYQRGDRDEANILDPSVRKYQLLSAVLASALLIICFRSRDTSCRYSGGSI